MRRFGVFFDLRLNKRLSKQSPSRSLWRHCNTRKSPKLRSLRFSRFLKTTLQLCFQWTTTIHKQKNNQNIIHHGIHCWWYIIFVYVYKYQQTACVLICVFLMTLSGLYPRYTLYPYYETRGMRLYTQQRVLLNSLRPNDAYMYVMMKWAIFGWSNGLAPNRRQAITSTKDGSLSGR